MQINLETIVSHKLILLESVSGSHAYGLSTPDSDTDIRGVFILPELEFFGLNYVDQVNDPGNDIVFYELRRFFELLLKNNPNILELTAMPEDCIRFRHPLFEQLKPEIFLSRLCRDTFSGYARAQIQKARGLNKKIMQPMEEERKGILDFCHVVEGQGAIPVLEWLNSKGIQQEACGLVKIPHMRDLYGLFHDPTGDLKFRGIARKETSNGVAVSSVPKGMEPIAWLSFNKDGYTLYCKQYKAYWKWVEDRNEARYRNTIGHGKNYDAKNMMHTFRLLAMSEEIATEGKILVRRKDRDFLLKIRKGEFDYEELVGIADERISKIDELFEKSDLPDQPDPDRVNEILIDLRKSFYAQYTNP